MRLLIDTSVFIWLAAGADRLQGILPVLRESENETFVSTVTFWELAIKNRIGKYRIDGTLEDVVAKQMSVLDARELIISLPHLSEYARLPLLHRDPFDGILVAQARVEGMTVVTSDAHIAEYDVPVLWRTE